jgi:hypothetical protein
VAGPVLAWWRKYDTIIVGLASLVQALVAIALISLAIQANSLQGQVVRLEASLHETDIQPIDFSVCLLRQDNMWLAVGNVEVVNRGLQASSIDFVGVGGIGADGAENHSVLMRTFEMPANGSIDLATVDESQAAFNSYLQPGEKQGIVVSFPFMDGRELLNFLELTVVVQPVLGPKASLSIGNGREPLWSMTTESGVPCIGTIPWVLDQRT